MVSYYWDYGIASERRSGCLSLLKIKKARFQVTLSNVLRMIVINELGIRFSQLSWNYPLVICYIAMENPL
jgi:hypothetical protein